MLPAVSLPLSLLLSLSLSLAQDSDAAGMPAGAARLRSTGCGTAIATPSGWRGPRAARGAVSAGGPRTATAQADAGDGARSRLRQAAVGSESTPSRNRPRWPDGPLCRVALTGAHAYAHGRRSPTPPAVRTQSHATAIPCRIRPGPSPADRPGPAPARPPPGGLGRCLTDGCVGTRGRGGRLGQGSNVGEGEGGGEARSSAPARRVRARPGLGGLGEGGGGGRTDSIIRPAYPAGSR